MPHMNIYHVIKLMAIAAQLSGYPLPPTSPPPQVVEFNIMEIAEWACPEIKDPRQCPIYGRYWDTDVIVVDAEASNLTPGGPSEDSVVIHEMVHWLQDHNGVRGFDCPLILRREQEAYAVQNLYVQKYERQKLVLQPPKELCATT